MVAGLARRNPARASFASSRVLSWPGVGAPWRRGHAPTRAAHPGADRSVRRLMPFRSSGPLKASEISVSFFWAASTASSKGCWGWTKSSASSSSESLDLLDVRHRAAQAGPCHGEGRVDLAGDEDGVELGLAVSAASTVGAAVLLSSWMGAQ